MNKGGETLYNVGRPQHRAVSPFFLFPSLRSYMPVRVLPRKNPQSGTRFDKVCHIAELEGIMLEGIYGNYYYRGNKFILC